MFGLVMLSIVAAYVLLTRFIAKHMPSQTWKWTVVALFVLIPAGDTAVGYVYFRYLCATESGNRIYKTAENVEGFYGSVSEDYFKMGYRYIEDRAPNGSYRRWTLGQNGKLKLEEVTALQSRYGVKFSDFIERRTSQIDRYQISIYDLRDRALLAKRTRLGFRGGWILQKPGELFLGRSGGVLSWCPHNPEGDIRLIPETLKTTTSTR